MHAVRKISASWVKLFALLSTVLFSNHALPADNAKWVSGGYIFSDERGGFKIVGISGSGSRNDPIILHQEIATSQSITLVIRPVDAERVRYSLGLITNGALYIKLVTHNQSNLPWVGYGLELQEILHKPSIYGDGLSFDQLSRESTHIQSDRFLDHELQFEPGDRLVYTNGWVDDHHFVSLKFKITDFTPVAEFFLLQDPMIPAS